MPQIARAGKDRLLAFHVCDWLVPTKDILNDRGMMGDGVIDIKSVRSAVEAQGFAGYSEIEIFSERLVGQADGRGPADLHRAAPDGGRKIHQRDRALAVSTADGFVSYLHRRARLFESCREKRQFSGSRFNLFRVYSA